MKILTRLLFCLTLTVFLSAGQEVMAGESSAPDQKDLPSVGEVEFTISCDTSVQEMFNQSVAMLHHMMYAQSHDLFMEMTETDPDCAMLHWGVAMTYLHPLWAPPSESDLNQGMAAFTRASELGAPTERELQYIDAIGAYFKGWQERTHPERLASWQMAQTELFQAYPDDIDAAGFYALSLLATAPKADKTFSQQEKAGQLLEDLHRKAPMHPAGYHYTIHAYDNPVLAPKALDFPGLRCHSTGDTSRPAHANPYLCSARAMG